MDDGFLFVSHHKNVGSMLYDNIFLRLIAMHTHTSKIIIVSSKREKSIVVISFISPFTNAPEYKDQFYIVDPTFAPRD